MGRRDWLRLGGLSLGALCGGLSPSQLLLEAAPQLVTDADGVPLPQLNDDYSVILFWANGGPSHLDLFDLKPDAPSEYRGPFRPIETNVPGIEISDQLPLLSRLADKFSLVRSLHHERAEHSGGTNRLLTGYPSIQANLRRSEFPTIGSVVAKHMEAQFSEIPPFIGNTPFYGGGAAYLGPSCEAYMPNEFPNSASGANRYGPVPIYRIPGTADDLTISEGGVLSLKRRRRVLEQLERVSSSLEKNRSLESVDIFRQRALAMLASPRTRVAFDLERESPRTRQRYGDTHWGKSLLTCRRLVESGVRFVQCQASYRLRRETGRTSNWDDHSVNADIFKAYRERMPVFDQAVPALINDLYDRGLNEKVLFIFCGEFGRTPKIRHQDKATKRPGRDHWARSMSIFLSGGGLKMGQVVGATNSRGEDPVRRVMNSNCLLSTVYRRFGVNTEHHFFDNTGRPVPILTDGEPISELL
mgnify:CR=1 FL=1